MKKNRMLKLASAMVILCLITTCAISTTFAKYTTGGSTSDEARVAKWGVEVVIDGDPMFSNEYFNADNRLTVKSIDDKSVVAPGTSSGEAGSLIFAISGTPEVAVNIDIELDITSDVVLKAGKYYDGTQATTTENGSSITYAEFTLGADYYPVVFTLEQLYSDSGVVMPTVTGTLAQIKAAIEAYSTSVNSEYAPNTVLDATFELSWAWAFDGNDAADTLLGNLMADTIPAGALQADPDNYKLTVSYEISITVTQID